MKTTVTVLALLLAIGAALHTLLTAATVPTAAPVFQNVSQVDSQRYSAEYLQRIATGSGVATLPAARPVFDNFSQIDCARYSAEYLQDILATGSAVNADWKTNVRGATTANITIATALNNGDTLDGLTLATGDRVLVKNQSTASQNGIYVVAASPARASDSDTWSELPGSAVLVTAGTANANKLFINTSAATGTVGSTNITYAEFTSGGGSVATDPIFENKGYIAAGTGVSSATGVPPGANGTVLVADDAEAAGVKWANVAGTGDVVAAANIADEAIVVGDGGAKGVKQLPLGTANQLLHVNAAGTAAEFTSDPEVDSVTATTASVGSLIFEGATEDDNETSVVVTDPTGDNDFTIPDADTFVPIIPQQITVSGPTAARTITVPDANFTVARTDAANTFTGTQTLAENASVALDPAGSADGKYSGLTIAGTAGAALAFGDLIVLDVTDSRWELADANSAAAADGDARGMIGICVLAAAGDGSATVILLNGVVRADTAFPSLTVNGTVHISETAGDVTSTSPTTEDAVIRPLGTAITADEIYFNPSPTSITYDAP